MAKVEAESLAHYDEVEVEVVALADTQAVEASAHVVVVDVVAKLYEQRSIHYYNLYVHLLQTPNEQ